MNKELFYEIILFAEDKGFKEHLNMLPAMPVCVTSYISLAKAIFWQKRYEIIFNHEFAKAIYDENIAKAITFLLTEEITGKTIAGLFKKTKFIKKFGKKLYTEMNEMILVYGQNLPSITVKMYKKDIIDCLKNKYKCSVLFGHDYYWKEYFQQMVLEEEPFEYLEQEYKRIKQGEILCRT